MNRPSQPTLTPATLAWVRSLAAQHGVTEHHIIDSCNKEYKGGAEEAKRRADMTQEVINDYRTSTRFAPPPLVAGSKPSPGEKVIITRVSDTASLRIWGDMYHDRGMFAFDFVDNWGRYIKTSPGTKIFADRPDSGCEILSLEERLAKNHPHASQVVDYDPEWETYLVVERTRMCVVQPGYPDFYITIPSWRPRGSTCAIISEYW
ncbi:hypothetical protein BD779DRAFT_1520446 [Infundibulicybe gibba]|nr:hypothetical protein BD779DRAFT_1520446 [Infundibulicybe gibba]